MRTVEVDVPFDFCNECQNFRMGINASEEKESYTCLLSIICRNAVEAAQFFSQAKGNDSEDDLRPCPRCGSENIRFETIDRYDGSDTYIAVCNGCGCIGPEAKTKEESAKAWNEMWLRGGV